MAHRGGLSLSIIIWRIGGGVLLPWGPKILLAALCKDNSSHLWFQSKRDDFFKRFTDALMPSNGNSSHAMMAL